MKKSMILSDSLKVLIALFLFSATLFIGCQQSDPDPQTPGTGTTPPGSSTTTPGSSTTATTPGSSTTATTPGSSTTATTPVVVSVPDYLKSASNLTMLSAAVQRAGLATSLGQGTLTVFAPTDDAFRAAGYADVNAVNAAQPADLQRLIQYHVLASRIDASAFPTAVNTTYQTLLADGQVSVFKTTDGLIMVDKAKVTKSNIPATNGVIHLIDQVLVAPTVSIVDRVKASDVKDLSLFMAAVARAGVQNTLTANTKDGITVFAPNDAAFKAAGYADAAAIQAADPKVLANLLTYHVLNYRAFSRTFQNGADIKTAQGGTLHFNVSGDNVTIVGKGNGTNAANITQADLVSTNGIIHVIDRVLLPQ
ncbi:fasciclin domain-containing protein [Spirosoma sp. KNUC1025]|uniref:fasciclin domain-containing protein n=1 Tax=Spirosoma sp. KNUC1025 TaxID=2894082 RepID=UPI003870E336|nr:fasciclin domain-containing protein [Spirosoma sp. KNUC1025]